jgi:hypothetical protein
MRQERSQLVPGHRMWRVKRVRPRSTNAVSAVRARHRLWRWRTIVVATRDLRFGAEAVARYLDGDAPGLPTRHGRRHVARPRQPDPQRNPTTAGGAV